MICHDIICNENDCKCLPTEERMKTVIKGWLIGFALLLMSGCGAVGYYLGKCATESYMHKVCQTGELFEFKKIEGEYSCYRVDVSE